MVDEVPQLGNGAARGTEWKGRMKGRGGEGGAGRNGEGLGAGSSWLMSFPLIKGCFNPKKNVLDEILFKNIISRFAVLKNQKLIGYAHIIINH